MRKPNIERLSLKSLRDHLNATTLDVCLPDDDGDVHHMVYVPRFTVPADLIAEGVPSQDLDLGGFLVDKYPNSAIEYPGGARKASSRPLQAPWFSLGAMDDCAALRKFDGVAVRSMGLREWGHLAWLVRLLGHTLKGNTQGRRDARDAATWASYAERIGQLNTTYPGTGPWTWFHNGLPSGIADLLGGLHHFLSVDGGAPGSLLVVRQAVLSESGGINDSEGDFQISNPLHGYNDACSFENWPATNGLLRLGDELVVYSALTIDPGDPSIAHLADCARGQYDTSAAVHAEHAECRLERWHVVAPGSYTAALGVTVDADDDALVLDWSVFAHGERDAEPAVGDVLCLGSEDVRVDQVDGLTLTVTRGHNGTTPEPHDAGAMLAKYPATLTRASQGYVSGHATGAVRTHIDLEELYLPSATQPSIPQTGLKRFVQYRLNEPASPRWFGLRGASCTLNSAEDMLALQLVSDVSYPSMAHFRCVRYLLDR